MEKSRRPKIDYFWPLEYDESNLDKDRDTIFKVETINIEDKFEIAIHVPSASMWCKVIRTSESYPVFADWFEPTFLEHTLQVMDFFNNLSVIHGLEPAYWGPFLTINNPDMSKNGYRSIKYPEEADLLEKLINENKITEGDLSFLSYDEFMFLPVRSTPETMKEASKENAKFLELKIQETLPVGDNLEIVNHPIKHIFNSFEKTHPEIPKNEMPLRFLNYLSEHHGYKKVYTDNDCKNYKPMGNIPNIQKYSKLNGFRYPTIKEIDYIYKYFNMYYNDESNIEDFGISPDRIQVKFVNLEIIVRTINGDVLRGASKNN